MSWPPIQMSLYVSEEKYYSHFLFIYFYLRRSEQVIELTVVVVDIGVA